MNTLRRIRISRVLLLAALTLCCGWGKDGHKIASTIAEQHLSPEANAAVFKLLGDQSLVQASTWADEIRSDPTYRWAAPLHYANVQPGAKGFDLKRDYPEQGCVVSAIDKYAGVLRDKQSTPEQKTEALKFLVHFVEDVHQPMHVSHAKDKGGNDIKVEFFENRTNLHAVWDSGLIRRTKKSWSDYATELEKGITPEQIAEQKHAGPVERATESYLLSPSHGYAIPRDGRLGQAYFDRCIPLVDQRLEMAGIRLATMLNEIFVDGTVPDPVATMSPSVEAGPMFVGSRNSDVYHYPNCSVVKQIKPQNLVEYDSAPEGKRLHKGCPR